jgi:hypothetical protein
MFELVGQKNAQKSFKRHICADFRHFDLLFVFFAIIAILLTFSVLFLLIKASDEMVGGPSFLLGERGTPPP